MSPPPRRQQLHLINQTIIPHLPLPRPAFPLPDLGPSRGKVSLYTGPDPPISNVVGEGDKGPDDAFEKHLADAVLGCKGGLGVGDADEGV
jgi:hypothetical protein